MLQCWRWYEQIYWFSWSVHFQKLFEDSRLILILAQTFFLAFSFFSLLRLLELSVLFIFTKFRKNIRMPSYPSIIFWWCGAWRYDWSKLLTLLPQIPLGLCPFWPPRCFSIPIVVLMILPRLKEMNDDMIKAAWEPVVQMPLANMLFYLTPATIAGYFMAFTY